MSANVEAMVREGVNAFKAGRKDEARALLLKATELDQYNEQAWLWLSGLMDAPDDQRTCLENVLAINPNNERASQGLSYLTGGQAAQSSGFGSSPFSSAPPPAPSPSAPTSVEWGAPSEPETPAWNRNAPRGEPVGDALDDWVSNLNLQAADPSGGFTFTSAGAGAGAAASPFSEFEMDEEDVFAEGPFSAAPAQTALDETFAVPAPPRRSPTPAPQPAERRRRTSPPPPRSEGSLLFDLESDRKTDKLAEDEGGMFGYIPAEIAPTRLPGTRERTPAVLMLGMIVLIVLNVGAAVLLMLGLLT